MFSIKINQIFALLFYAIIFFLPYIQLGLNIGPFKLTISDSLLIILFILLLSNLYVNTRLMPLFVATLVFISTTSLSIINAINLSITLLSLLPWVYGIIIILTTGIMLKIIPEEILLKRIRDIFVISITLSAIPYYLTFFSLYSFPQLFYNESFGRYMYFTINPNQYMVYVVVGFFIIFLIDIRYNYKEHFNIIFILSVFLVLPALASGSKTGFLSITLIILLSYIFSLRYSSKKILKFVVPLILFSSLSLNSLIFDFIGSDYYFMRAFSVFDIVSSNNDQIISALGEVEGSTGHSIKKGLELFFNHPILGLGLGNFMEYNNGTELHNSAVSILVETGILGLLSLLFLIFSVIKSIFSKGIIGGITSLQIFSLSFFLFFLIMNIPHILIRERWTWLFLCILCLLNEKYIIAIKKKQIHLP